MDLGAVLLIAGGVLLIIVALALLLSFVASALVIGFTAFVAGLPLLFQLLLFVLLPPAFILYLIGLAMIRHGYADRMLEAAEPRLPRDQQKVDAAAQQANAMRRQ